MAHFAKIDKNNIVTNVLVAEQDFINSGTVGDSFEYVQTSYNENFRGKYAGVGDTWDPVNQKFISPQPYPSWVLNEHFRWEAPVSEPDEFAVWNEDTGAWDIQEYSISEDE